MDPANNPAEYSLTTAIRNLEATTELCDATLVANDGLAFPVHTYVLAARSQYFKATFFGMHKQVTTNPTIELDFEGDVLKAIKSYCYTDSCDDGFSDLLKKKLPSRFCSVIDYGLPEAYLLKGLQEGELAARGRFLVQLTAAADYLLLPGLVRMLWKQAYLMMRFRIPSVIPTIYGEAATHGTQELLSLAQHSFGMPLTDGIFHEHKRQGSESFKLQEDVPESLKRADPRADYKGLGLIFLAGCSESHINGEYYGIENNGGRTIFEKAENGLRGMRVYEEWDECGRMYSYFLAREDKELRYEFIMASSPTSTDHGHWKVDWSHYDDLTKKEKFKTPPVCFVFTKGRTWQELGLKAPHPLLNSQRTGSSTRFSGPCVNCIGAIIGHISSDEEEVEEENAVGWNFGSDSTSDEGEEEQNA